MLIGSALVFHNEVDVNPTTKISRTIQDDKEIFFSLKQTMHAQRASPAFARPNSNKWKPASV